MTGCEASAAPVMIGAGPAPGLPVSALVTLHREGRTLCAVTRPVRFTSPRTGVVIETPAGYLTDWASVPSIAQLRIQPFGRHAAAALLHDWLYAIGEPGRRAEADALFLERMEIDGVNPVRRSVMYRAVRLGGGGGYGAAARTWPRNFCDPWTGAAVAPPFTRESRFGWGLAPVAWGE